MKRDRLDWLDYARFFAAFVVMAYHYLARGPAHGSTLADSYGLLGTISSYGYLGVDLFFIISGFVILESALDRPADKFAVGRAVRLWPTFLVCMTASALIQIAAGRDIGLMQYLGNLTLVPTYVGVKPVDGAYWSLAYELTFYAAVFALILVGGMRRARMIVVGWTVVQMFHHLLHLPDVPLIGGYFPLFAGGCLLALIHRQGPRLELVIGLIIAVGLSMFEAAERAVVLGQVESFSPNPGLVAALVALAYAPFLVFRTRNPKLPLGALAGGLTYPLYLLHQQIGYVVLSRLPVEKHVAAILAMALAVVLALIVHLGFEKTTKGFWMKLFDASLGRAVRFARPPAAAPAHPEP